MNNYDKQFIIDNIYKENFDLNLLSKEEKEMYENHSFTEIKDLKWLKKMHFLTLGISTLIWYGMQYSKLPKIQKRDFDTRIAFAFSFIPLFNFYWMFVVWSDLIKRINLQLKLRNLPLINPVKEKYTNINAETFIPLSGLISIIPFGFIIGIYNYLFVAPKFLEEIHISITRLIENNK